MKRHKTFGPVTIYPRECAMHGAVDIETRWGYLCIHPPIKAFGRWWKWYVYLSTDATPTSAKWGFGPGFARYI